MSDLLAAFAIRKPSITVDTADGSDVVGGGGGVKNVGMGTPATGVSHGGDYEGTRQSVFAGMEVMGCDDDTGVSGGENFKRKIGGGSTEVLTKSGGGKAEGQKVKNAGRKKAKKGRDFVLFKRGAWSQTLLCTHRHFGWWAAGMW
jgi:hypothetical protein